jgi:predicted RNase H-like HicB family nuclease
VRAKVDELAAPREISIRVGGRGYRAVLTPDLRVGGYTVEVPELPGVVTEGDTIGEARKMTTDAIRLWLASREERSTARRISG